MKRIVFKICICGMSDKNYMKRVMIYKPFVTFKAEFCFKRAEEYEGLTLGELIDKLKCREEYKAFASNYYSDDDFNIENIYIKRHGALLGLNEDKSLCDIFKFFKAKRIEAIYFFVAGGASVNCEGYKLVIHTNEEIHRNTPHVHVVKDNMSVRYHLETLERFSQDKCSREYKRDEKKIIIPGILKNKQQLIKLWRDYNGGYEPPVMDIKGNQYYKES